jgi:hypothetical protein
MINTEAWRRVGTRIAEKARQTADSPAWLRIDDTGALLRLTDQSTQPLQILLRDLQSNANAALADAPHVRGIILGVGTMIDPGTARDETAWGQSGPATLITPGPPRHLLADGPSAAIRRLPGGRSRLTFILPGPHPNLILPPGAGLEPGLWYHNEPTWLNQALQTLGHLPLTASLIADYGKSKTKGKGHISAPMRAALSLHRLQISPFGWPLAPRGWRAPARKVAARTMLPGRPACAPVAVRPWSR